jgi:hypothetical protein
VFGVDPDGRLRLVPLLAGPEGTALGTCPRTRLSPLSSASPASPASACCTTGCRPILAWPPGGNAAEGSWWVPEVLVDHSRARRATVPMVGTVRGGGPVRPRRPRRRLGIRARGSCRGARRRRQPCRWSPTRHARSQEVAQWQQAPRGSRACGRAWTDACEQPSPPDPFWPPRRGLRPGPRGSHGAGEGGSMARNPNPTPSRSGLNLASPG